MIVREAQSPGAEIVAMPLNGRVFSGLALLTPSVLPNAPGGYGCSRRAQS